jgi:choline dehydrogenase-like flavoprotein
MLFDAQDMDRGRFAREFDVCVVGSGPAGITLARALAAKDLAVALMEAGGLEPSAESQEFYVGDVTGFDYYAPDVSRLRCFGGSSVHWGGRCRPLDALDFAAQPGRLSGWPIGKADLDPYRAAANDILDLGPADFADPDPADPEAHLRRIVWKMSPPTRFAEKYRDALADDERIALVVNANLVDLRLDDTLATVTGAVFRSYRPDDPGFTVRAKRYALCLGGLENPRMLLNCRSQIPTGIGNANDLVGRYFCEHLHYHFGDVILERRLHGELSFAPTPEFMQAQGILAAGLFVGPRVRDFLSFPKEAARSAVCLTPFADRLARSVLHQPARCDTLGLGEYFARRHGEAGLQAVARMAIEQPLIHDSRVLLGPERDAFGLRRMQLDWRIDDQVRHTIRVGALTLASLVAEQGIGRVRLREWFLTDPLRLPPLDSGQGGVGGFHHMCTTRMSEDPAQGVVDRDCRVHGTENLYVGGSSVFASTGHANPTYTIVQLALRLGDHLDKDLHA